MLRILSFLYVVQVGMLIFTKFSIKHFCFYLQMFLGFYTFLFEFCHFCYAALTYIFFKKETYAMPMSHCIDKWENVHSCILTVHFSHGGKIRIETRNNTRFLECPCYKRHRGHNANRVTCFMKTNLLKIDVYISCLTECVA